MVTVCCAVTALVVIANVCELKPEEIVTLEGTVATAVLLLLTVTILFAGALPFQ